VYIDALPELEAQEQMNLIEAVTYPHMKKADQSRISRRLNRMAGRAAPEPVKAKTMEEASQVLGGMGIAVEVVS
jgi:transcription elongation GreA/GreB family factor